MLDACVLIPRALRDVLLSVADADLYRPVWQECIEDEVVRNGARLAVERGDEPGDAAAAEHRAIGHMNRAFPDARRPDDEWSQLVDEMECDPKDRHVLAVAVGAQASHLVTDNIKDFPPAGRQRIEVIRPDAFLVEMLVAHPADTVAAVETMAARHQKPAHTAIELAERFASGQAAPKFGSKLRELLLEREELGDSSVSS